MVCCLRKFNPLMLLFLLLLLYSNFAHTKTYSILAIEGKVKLVSEAERVVKAAYAQLGHDIALTATPFRRSLVQVNNGLADGELMRMAGLEADYKNLVMVNVPISKVEMVGFVKKNLGRVTGMDALKGKKVCIVQGMRIAELMTEGLKPSTESSIVGLFRSLTVDQCDVAIMDRHSGLSLLEKKFKDSKIKVGSDILASIKLYHYLHKRNKALVPQLESAFKSLRDKGILKRYR